MLKDRVEDIVGKEIYFSDPAEQLEAVKAITAWVRENGKDETKYSPEFAWQTYQYFYKMPENGLAGQLGDLVEHLNYLTLKNFLFVWFITTFRDDLTLIDRMNLGFQASPGANAFAAKGVPNNIYDLMFDQWSILGQLDGHYKDIEVFHKIVGFQLQK